MRSYDELARDIKSLEDGLSSPICEFGQISDQQASDCAWRIRATLTRLRQSSSKQILEWGVSHEEVFAGCIHGWFSRGTYIGRQRG